MKITKKIIICFLSIVLIGVLGGMFFKISSKPITPEKWLEKNNIVLNENDFSTLKSLKDDLNNYNIFLTGEEHGLGINDIIDFNFLKFLNKEEGVKYYLIENSPAVGYFINEYVHTGDNELLEKIMKNTYFSKGYAKEYSNKLKKIYELNKTLKDDEKIQVIGIDIDGLPFSYYDSLKCILSRNNMPIEIKKDVEKFFNNEEKYLKKDVDEFKNTILQKNDIYEKFLGKDFDTLKYILNSFTFTLEDQYQQKHGSTYAENFREEKMYENFKTIYEKDPNSKYYGHFGDAHISRVGNHLASFINNRIPKLKNKVLSIQCSKMYFLLISV